MKETAVVFGIVTPSFNQGAFLPKTLQSVIKQFQKKDFYIVMDAGSTDSTVSTLKKHSKKLRFISAPDHGQADAINKGIAHIEKWLKLQKLNPEQVIFAYINSDDYYLPGALKKVRQTFASEPDLKWLVGDCQIVNQKGSEIQKTVRWYKSFFRLLISWPVMMILNPIPQPAVFIRFSALKKVGNFNQKLHFTMDYEYWLRLWQKFGAPRQTQHALAAFRIHQASKGNTGYQKQFAEQLRVTTRFTRNQAWLFLQKLHNRVITASYQLLK